MAYVAYVTTLKNVRKHPNADRLLLGDCFGNTVCVNLDYAEGEIGIYFPTDGQLSVEFAEQNNLLRKKDENGNNIGGYMDPDKRNVTAVKLRGEKSDGLFLPLSCVAYTGVNLDDLNVGDTITTVNGHEICTKYIPRTQKRVGHPSAGNRTRKKKVPTAPLFVEHADTEQLAYNLGAFRIGDNVEVTLKMHGTSQRTGYLPIFQGYKDSWHCHLKNWVKIAVEKMRHRMPIDIYKATLDHDGEPIYDWGYVTGTRRVVLDTYDGGFYGSNEFREQHHKMFEGKLHKGETVYYEVVGFTTDGASIMSTVPNKRTADKEFIKQYGETTVFSYGCEPSGYVTMYGEDEHGTFSLPVAKPQSDVYVYRMTMTNEDGDVVEYTPDFMRYRCEQMGVKTVPVFANFIIPDLNLKADLNNEAVATPAGDYVKEIAEMFYDGPDPVGKTHVREGVVCRIVNRPKFAAFKHKNFSFKCLEGIAKADAEAPDMEEAQGLEEDNG